MIFKVMALCLLGIVYLALFSSTIPWASNKQKSICACLGLAMSAYLFFIAPEIFQDIS